MAITSWFQRSRSNSITNAPQSTATDDLILSDCRLMLRHIMDNGLVPSETLRRKIAIVDRRLAQKKLPTISGLASSLILKEDELVKVTTPPTPPIMPPPENAPDLEPTAVKPAATAGV